MRSMSVLVSVLVPVCMGLSPAHGQQESTCTPNPLHLPCGQANPGVGGCADNDCCRLVCADFNALCCEDLPLGWIQQCADYALLNCDLPCPSDPPPVDPGVSLYAQVTLAQFGNPSDGNDCWGYVAPSGREYALMGVANALKVVEITDPSNPVIIGSIPHSDILWADVKTYQSYAYVVNESGGGMDIVDLSDADNGNVSLVQSYTGGGLQTSHNIAVDTDSGFLYLCDSNIHGGRLVALDLADPENPVEAGSVSNIEGVGVHDAQIVTYTSGPNAGKQIAFCANEFTGVDIYDVTDKSNMFRLSRTTYPNLSYCHQCWLSDDRQYLYVNDESDGVNETVIFDVTDLSNPVIVNTYTSCLTSTDHNQYFHAGFMYEADYTSGLRIFCADDPVDPVQVGWYDTYPPNNSPGFAGAWSVYPFFPSGVVIVSDRQGGLFILDPTDAQAGCGNACPWDCDGSDDGIVSVTDLLAVLAQYDTTNPPCDGGGACDFDGNGCVDVSDLLKLLAHYDPAGAGCP